jgi:hypothetical protein
MAGGECMRGRSDGLSRGRKPLLRVLSQALACMAGAEAHLSFQATAGPAKAVPLLQSTERVFSQAIEARSLYGLRLLPFILEPESFCLPDGMTEVAPVQELRTKGRKGRTRVINLKKGPLG